MSKNDRFHQKSVGITSSRINPRAREPDHPDLPGVLLLVLTDFPGEPPGLNSGRRKVSAAPSALEIFLISHKSGVAPQYIRRVEVVYT